MSRVPAARAPAAAARRTSRSRAAPRRARRAPADDEEGEACNRWPPNPSSEVELSATSSQAECKARAGRGSNTHFVAFAHEHRVERVDGGAVRAGVLVVERVPHEERERAAGRGPEQQRQQRSAQLGAQHVAPSLCARALLCPVDEARRGERRVCTRQTLQKYMNRTYTLRMMLASVASASTRCCALSLRERESR